MSKHKQITNHYDYYKSTHKVSHKFREIIENDILIPFDSIAQTNCNNRKNRHHRGEDLGNFSIQEFNSRFNGEMVRLVIPIILQNLISATVVTADILMLGFINQYAMSAVSLGGQVTFVLNLFYFGLATGVGILTAQYWGKRDRESIKRVLSIGASLSVIFSFVFFLASIFIPELLMKVFTNDERLIAYGMIYLRPIAFTYLAMSLSQMYLSVLKSIENTRLSAWISSSSLIINVILDGLVVYILFPNDPEKAILGVAITTVIARSIEMIWSLVHSKTKGGISFHLPFRDEIERVLRKDFIRYTLPVLGNYIIWGGALTATTTIIGHVSADMVAANSIASVIRNLSVVICGGIAAGGAVLIGKYLGQNQIEWAKRVGNRVRVYAFAFGILAGLFVLLVKPLVFQIVNLNDTARIYLNGMLYVSAYYCIGKALNSTIIGGVFPAGGDSKFGFWCDTIVMWFIVSPLSFFAAFALHLPPVWIYVVISLDELIKLPAALIRYRQYKWLTNITRDFT